MCMYTYIYICIYIYIYICISRLGGTEAGGDFVGAGGRETNRGRLGASARRSVWGTTSYNNNNNSDNTNTNNNSNNK